MTTNPARRVAVLVAAVCAATAGCAEQNEADLNPRGEPMERGSYRKYEPSRPSTEPLVVHASDNEPGGWEKFWRAITFQENPAPPPKKQRRN